MPADTPFWDLAEPWLDRSDVTRSTMMGFPCLRRDGAFFACAHRASGDLIVKLSPSEVGALVDRGEALPFAPNGRVFKAWAQIPQDRVREWPDRLQQAYDAAADEGGAR